MTYREEFPDFDRDIDVDQLSRWGFEDQSWHRDACPSFRCDVFVIYIDYLDPTKREFPEIPCFAIWDESRDVLNTDNWEDVRAFVEDGKRDFPDLPAPNGGVGVIGA